MSSFPERLIERAHLLRRLQAALRAGHVIVTAPAGYGKTSLLRLLAAQRPHSYLVTLELADADAGQLRAKLSPHLQPGATLLLDEMQVLSGAVEALAWLVEQAPATAIRLVLSGRQMPGELAALAATGPVARFTEHELAFTLGESKALLTAAGLDGDPQLDGWHTRTAGWPLALALLARQPKQFATLEPAGRHDQAPGELLECLAELLVGDTPPELQRFMALTAVPFRFTDELAATLLGATPAAAADLRAQVLRRNLFLADAGPGLDGWFRYHDLIRDFMLARLARFGEDARERFRGVAEWFAARDDLPQAIEHARAGALSPFAAELIERLPLEWVRNTGRYHSFRRWVLGLDQTALAANPLLLARLGYELLDINHNEEAWQHLNAALRLAQESGNVPAQHNIQVSMAKAHRFEGRPQQSLEIGLALLADPNLPPDLRRRALSNNANSYVQLSQFRLARRAYHELLATDEQPGALPNAFYRANLASVALVPLGDYDEAQRILEANNGYFADKSVGRSLHWLGWCAYYEARGDWNNLERALHMCGAAEAEAEQQDSNNVWTAWWWALLEIGCGRYAPARQRLAEAEALAGPNPEEPLCIAAANTWLLRREGRFEEAIATADAVLGQSLDSPLYRAVLALERDLAVTAAGRSQRLNAEVANLARLRAQSQLLRLHALLAVRCWRAGQSGWRRQAAAVLRALRRPGYASRFNRRDPDLAAQFWIACLQEGFGLEPALDGLRTLGTWEPLAPLLSHPDGGVRARAARGLKAIGREEGMPALAAALAVEPDEATARAVEGALEALEHAPPLTLHVRLLGEFAVRRGDRPIESADWQRPAVRRLFQYLVLHRGLRLSRDRILDDLWAGADPAASRSSFNQVFSWLRRLLEPAMRPRAGSRYLTVEDDTYCFDPRRDPQVAVVDVEAFEAAVRPVLAASELPDLAPLPEALLTALAAWRPLLPDVPYEAWTLAPRERLLNLYVDGCLYAAQALLDRARPAEAAPWAARALAEAPWREEGYQAQMRAQARLGNRSLALKTYAEAVAALERELNAAPSALTRWLGQRLQQGEEI